MRVSRDNRKKDSISPSATLMLMGMYLLLHPHFLAADCFAEFALDCFAEHGVVESTQL